MLLILLFIIGVTMEKIFKVIFNEFKLFIFNFKTWVFFYFWLRNSGKKLIIYKCENLIITIYSYWK